MNFIQTAIRDYRASDLYQTAVIAQKYYDGENPTIMQYQKIIYDVMGLAHKDEWSANHKIASQFFGFAVDQENGYLLGNGVSFGQNNDTKSKLADEDGKYSFDAQIQQAGEYALIGGVAYGFWNLDHVEVFSPLEFVPLFDEENGALSAGIRFWQVEVNKPLRATLYELDGYTEYIENTDKEKEMQVLVEKRPYILNIKETAADGATIYDGENYPTFPIVPLKNNRAMKSELCGKRNTIDALDLALSNMVNNVDEGNLIYWVIKNAPGMDDLDIQKFTERIKTLKVVQTEDGVDVDAHTLEAPVSSNQQAIDALYKQLYTDFQCFDSTAVTAGNQTATAIKASYVPLDLKTDKFERQVTKFIKGIMALAGVEGDPTYTRNQIINKQEEIQSIVLAAQYLDDDYITSKILTILGDIDQFEDIQHRKQNNETNRFGLIDDEDETE